jgi:hypothetical protein
LNHELKSTVQEERENQEWVMSNHTFVNRAKSILEFI